MNLKHGHFVDDRASPTYESWSRMKQRCDDATHEKYHLYGGRGIAYCERWKDFVYFLEDMGERPDNMTLDRIDRDKGYDKDNCKWSSVTDQNRNRSNVKLSLDDAIDICRRVFAGSPMRVIAAEYGISRESVSAIARGRLWKEAHEIAKADNSNSSASGN